MTTTELNKLSNEVRAYLDSKGLWNINVNNIIQKCICNSLSTRYKIEDIKKIVNTLTEDKLQINFNNDI